MKDFVPPDWGWLFRAGLITILAGIAIAIVLAILFDLNVISFASLAEYQTGYYAVLALGFSLILATVVDKRIENLQRNLEKKLDSRSHGCPRGHIWPVDGCPFCRRDSRYL